jgi:hypothetical protein
MYATILIQASFRVTFNGTGTYVEVLGRRVVFVVVEHYAWSFSKLRFCFWCLRERERLFQRVENRLIRCPVGFRRH